MLSNTFPSQPPPLPRGVAAQARAQEATGEPEAEPRSGRRPTRYTTLSKLDGALRAEVVLGIAEHADTLDNLVVIKSFQPGQPETTLERLTEELDLAGQLAHDNIARTLSIGYGAARYFIVMEYLEGKPLRVLLRWAALAGKTFPNAVITRVLLGVLDAVAYADGLAETSMARALVNQPVLSDDVFITYDGNVKILGFKASAANTELFTDGSRAARQPAIDAILSGHLTPELSRVLAALPSIEGRRSRDLWPIRHALHSWQSAVLGRNGQAELAALMSDVFPEGRARQKKLIETAYAATRRPGGYGTSPSNDAPKVQAPTPSHAQALASVPTFTSADAPAIVPAPTSAQALASPPAPASSNAPVTLPVRQGAPLLGGRGATGMKPISRASRVGWLALALICIASALGGMLFSNRRLISRGSAVPQVIEVVAVDSEGSALVEGSAGSARKVPAPPVAPSLEVAAVSVEPAANVAPSDDPRTHEASSTLLAERPSKPAAAPGSRPGASRPRSSRLARTKGASPLPESPPGYLTLDTTPWSTVSLGNMSLGQTPLVAVRLPPGDHVLELANSELGIVSRYAVSIASGETTTRRIGLEAPRKSQ